MPSIEEECPDVFMGVQGVRSTVAADPSWNTGWREPEAEHRSSSPADDEGEDRGQEESLGSDDPLRGRSSKSHASRRSGRSASPRLRTHDLNSDETVKQAETRAALRIQLSNVTARRIKCEQEEKRIRRALDGTPQ